MATIIPVIPMKYELFGGTADKKQLDAGQVEEFKAGLVESYLLPGLDVEASENVVPVGDVLFSNAWNAGESLPAVEWEFERLVHILSEVLPSVEDLLVK